MTNSPITLISNLSGSIQELKSIYEFIAPIKNTLLNPGQRRKITEWEEVITSTDNQLQELRSCVTDLSKLVMAYSSLIGDVRGAGASSDKFSELIELQPDLLLNLKTFFANKIRDEYSRVVSGIPTLPKPDGTESAKKVGNLEIISRNLRDLMGQLRDSNSSDSHRVLEISKQISSQYADMEATLSELLREILLELESA
jgi:hypothetical protein